MKYRTKCERKQCTILSHKVKTMALGCQILSSPLAVVNIKIMWDGLVK